MDNVLEVWHTRSFTSWKISLLYTDIYTSSNIYFHSVAHDLIQYPQ